MNVFIPSRGHVWTDLERKVLLTRKSHSEITTSLPTLAHVVMPLRNIPQELLFDLLPVVDSIGFVCSELITVLHISSFILMESLSSNNISTQKFIFFLG